MEQKDIVFSLLNSPVSEIRREAALAFRDFDSLEDDSIEALTKGLHDTDRGVRDACSMTLITLQAQGVEVASHVARQILTHDIEVRNLAGDVLIKLGESSASVLWDYARDTDFDVRKFAIDIIGLIGTEADVPILIAALQDADANVRVSAAEALGNIGSPYAILHLIEAYRADDEMKLPVIEALGKIGGDDAENFLLETLTSEDDMYLQTACIDSLALCGSQIGISTRLGELLPNAPTELQGIILKTMCAISFRLEQPIELQDNLRYVAYNALKDEDADIRAAGLIALGSDYTPEDFESLLTEMERNNEATQQHILYNLITSTDPNTSSQFVSELLTRQDEASVLLMGVFGILREIWSYATEEHKTIILNTLLQNFKQSDNNVNRFLFDFVLSLDRILAANTIEELLISENEEDCFRALDIIAANGLLELRDNVSLLSDEKTQFGLRAKEVLLELR